MSEADAESERFVRGMAGVHRVDGSNAEAIVAGLGDLGRYIVEFGYGDVYSRPGLSTRDRALITVAMLAAMGGREPQLDVHLRGALRAGITPAELEEVMIHTALYAGFPSAINGLRRLQALDGDGTPPAPDQPNASA